MSLSNYPKSIDTNQNLYQVHDALRVVLAEDYNPGDTSISIIGDESMMRMFNSTGIITLTDQCNDPKLRGLSFSYGSRTLTTFDQLVVLDGFTDVSKPKLLTSITQNVMAVHHNALKDAVITIESFAGIKGTTSIRPLEGSMEERINYLRKIALLPKAWFKSDKSIGLTPITVSFTNQSFRTGTDGTSYPVTYEWDFGDNTTSTLENPIHTYEEPNAYDVTLTVTNYFGKDTVKFPAMITARGKAPGYAVIDILEGTGQKITQEPSPINGPYITTPMIRSPINSIINIGIKTLPNTNINPNTNETFSGEPVDINDIPIDPITSYTWSISDDVSHSNSLNTRSVFSIGGIYDLTLRVDTKLGAYRITNYSNALDIVENFNLWLWTDSSSTSYPQTVTASEFGLISETFKLQSTALNLNIVDSFLTSINIVTPNKTQQY
jgi:PKD repeat protein